jgi:collagenase-like PrtC family protease
MNVITKLLTDSEMFMDNISIGAVYGSFPGAYWNGGRVMNGITDKQNIRATINAFNDQNVPIRFTFTNQLINKSLLYDPYCNMIMDLANNGMNEVLVNSPLLEKFLREHYPNFKYVSSTTKCITDVDGINKECEKYDMVVMDYRNNLDIDFHSKLKYKDKIEILINACCSPSCTRRKEHYEYLSRCQIDMKLADRFCDILAKSFWDSLKFNTVIKVDDLYNYYVPQGFKNFKIEGRTLHPIDVIDAYMYYMVKPEYQNELRNKLIKILW